MTNNENNLLLNLYYGTWKKEENFHTEAFVHLLRHLLASEPVAAINLLKAVTDKVLNVPLAEVKSVNINTQVTTTTGKPDIEIKTADTLVFVEVKVESRVDDSQLKKYREALNESGFKNTHLILLTKYPFIPQTDEKKPDFVFVRWFQIAECLEQDLQQGTISQPVIIYLAEQFLNFLQKRGMTLEPVNRELILGVQSLRNLLDMVQKALKLLQVKPKLDSGKDDYGYISGYKFNFGSGEYWVGIEYDRPDILLFVTFHEIDKEAYENLAIGDVDKDEGQWIHQLDLS